jgi:hypothetical protein
VADNGVEFLIQLNAKLDQVAKLVSELVKTQGVLAKTDAALRKVEHQTTMFGRAAGQAGSAFGSFGRATLAHLTALASFEGLKRLGNGIINIAQEALQAAGEAERTRTSFRLMMGEKPADDMLDWIDKVAQHTEFTDGPLKNFAAQLSKAGFAGEGMKDAMAAMLDIAARTPNKMEGAAQAVALLSRIRLTGMVDKRSLKNVGIEEKELFGRLSQNLGIGIKAVQKKLRAGKIDSTTLVNSLYAEIAEKTKKPLGGAGVQMSVKFLAQMEKVRDIVPNLFEDLEKSGGLKAVTGGLKRIAEALAPDSPAGKKIIAGLELILNRFGKFVETVDFNEVANRALQAMNILEKGIKLAVGLVDEVIQVLDLVLSFPDEVSFLAGELKKLVSEFFTAAAELGTAVWKGLVSGITGAVTGVVDSAKFLGNEVIRAIEGVLKIGSPSKVFAGLGMMTAAGFSAGIIAAAPNVQRTVASAFAPMSLMPALPALPAMATLAGAAAVASSPAAVGSAGGSPHLEAHVTVNVSGLSAGEAAGQQIAGFARTGVLEAFEGILSDLAAQGGGA